MGDVAQLLGDTGTAAGAASALRQTSAIRERARFLLERARLGESAWFRVDDDNLHTAAGEVAAVTLRRYPDLSIPVHSRWRHFEAGGVDRKSVFDAALGSLDLRSRARAMIDLTLISVLLDAGAGADWRYREEPAGPDFTRSEGLGVASFHAFMAGTFSSEPDEPLRVDAGRLRRLSTEQLAQAFQVDDNNQLVGLEGRVSLLRRLGRELENQPEVFGSQARPGGLFDAIVTADATPVVAHDILTGILTSLAGIWPADNMIGDQPVGDCWYHKDLGGPGLTKGWMPFHKLSQWLTYSLLEPLGWAGVTVEGLDELTGLPEYRNGGLLIDTAVLTLHDPSWSTRSWRPADELVVEWRALTVALLDELAPLVRGRLGLGTGEMPLACILEGGTWAAGRGLAQRLRSGLPPLNVISDGTVF